MYYPNCARGDNCWFLHDDDQVTHMMSAFLHTVSDALLPAATLGYQQVNLWMKQPIAALHAGGQFYRGWFCYVCWMVFGCIHRLAKEALLPLFLLGCLLT